MFAFADTSIELLCWGERGRPGLLLLHGSGAHAHWWSPIAALLADRYRVAAISWSGMGASGWRTQYSVDSYAAEAIAAAEEAGLFNGGPPVIVAHSFGGSPALAAGVDQGDRLAGIILADSFLDPNKQGLRPPPTIAQHRIYPTLAAALARFRFSPAQACENIFYADWIARHSLRRVEAHSDHAAGWTWRFDPEMWGRMGRSDSWNNLKQARCPIAAVRGARSSVLPDAQWSLIAEHAPAGSEFVTIADAAHHLMVDQPLAFAAEIRRVASRWLPA